MAYLHTGENLKEFFVSKPLFTLVSSQPVNELKAKISEAIASLVLDLPFFGYILSNLRIHLTNDEKNSKFCIDNQFLYFDLDFAESILQRSDWKNKVKSFLVHLTLHLIYKHIQRQKYRNPKIWAVAADIVIIQIMHTLGDEIDLLINITLPNVGSIPENLLNLTTEDVYAILQDDGDKEQILSSKQNNSEDFAGSKDKKLSDQEVDDFRDKLLKALPINLNKSKFKEFGDFVCDLDAVQTEMRTFDISNQHLQEEYIQGVLLNGLQLSSIRGNIPDSLKEVVEQLKTPRIDWRSQLSHLFQKVILSDFDWSRPNRRLYGQGVYLPSAKKENIRVVTAVDTSGSIKRSILTHFLSELQALLVSIANVELIVIDCDSEIKQTTRYFVGEPVSGHQFIGRGGTSFLPVFDLLPELDADLLVYFTDGYGDFRQISEPQIPVVWVLTGETKPPFGSTIIYPQ